MTEIDHKLNVATESYPEFQNNGIMICGYNWGLSKRDQRIGVLPDTRKGFFSDKDINNYPYRTKIVNWFQLWGHPLIKDIGHETGFEKCIVQTNWCSDQSPNNGNDLYSKCIGERDNFFYHLDFYKPAILIFMGIQMFDIFSSDICKDEAEACVGKRLSPTKYITHEVKRPTAGWYKQFRVGFIEHENCTVIGLPHPTSSKGLANDYIASFKDDISPIFDNFKNKRNFNNEN